MTLFRTFSLVNLGVTTHPLPISALLVLVRTCPVVTHWFPSFFQETSQDSTAVTPAGFRPHFIIHDYDPAKESFLSCFSAPTLFLL